MVEEVCVQQIGTYSSLVTLCFGEDGSERKRRRKKLLPSAQFSVPISSLI